MQLTRVKSGQPNVHVFVEGLNKINIKSYGIFHRDFTSNPNPFYGKKKKQIKKICYLFIIFIKTKFGENFE